MKLLSEKSYCSKLTKATSAFMTLLFVLMLNSPSESHDDHDCPWNPPSISKKLCEKIGGKWGMWSNAVGAVPYCNPPTSDAGKVCLDSSECDSYCMAPEDTRYGVQTTGACYGYEFAICMREVVEGVSSATWCQ